MKFISFLTVLFVYCANVSGQLTMKDAALIDSIAIVGAEDITIHQTSGKVFVSSDNRRAWFNDKKGVKGGIYLLDINNLKAAPIELTKEVEDDFHPHGISLVEEADGSLLLYVVNHKKEGAVIDLFRLEENTLKPVKRFSNPLLFNPNDVVGLDGNSFYATNERGSRKKFGYFFEMVFRQKKGYVVFCDGEKYTKSAKKIGYANGINMDKEGKTVYVAEVFGGRVHAYDRNPSDGTLKWRASQKYGPGIDNIELDHKGGLWFVGHSNLLKFVKHAYNAKKISPWVVYFRSKSDFESGKNKDKGEKRIVCKGKPISGASVAARSGNLVLVGSVFEKNILVFQLGEQEKPKK